MMPVEEPEPHDEEIVAQKSDYEERKTFQEYAEEGLSTKMIFFNL